MAQHSNPSAIQELSFEDLTGIEIQSARLDLTVEADDELTNMARLMVEPADGAPELAMRGSRLLLSHQGRYRGSSAPVLKLPATELPAIAANISSGNLTFENLTASIATNISSGNLRISGGSGDIAANVTSGDVLIRQREGNIACKVSSGHIAVTGCTGDIALNATKGDTDIQDCNGSLSLRLGKGDVVINRPVRQNVQISSSKGDVRINGGSLESADVDLTRGDIQSSARLLFSEWTEPAGEPVDSVEFEEALDDDVEGEDEEVHFNLGSVQFVAGESGVRVSTGGTERFTAGPEGVVVRRGDGTPVFVANEQGVTAGTPAGKSLEQFRFKTGRGSISLDVDEEQPARVELIVNRGDVQSDIRLVEVGRPGPRSSTRRYVGVSDSTETERILIRARTDRGDIRIRSVEAPRQRPESAGGSRRDRQRRQILEALAQGRLSAAEADALLAAMEREAS